ncbi:hypothetical protein ZYGR_0AG05520 [Zygosaccharomyces rouxii]|uniref:Copper transport protein n=1 Tax=Zygosaccharomyces rouxii TaxID=4956 RepID=A0A1Q3AAA2_ZYGRO|nr:hypothetical protein ZYGR_0AG05520 [Zygosaccharomyces rouxii]
MVARFIYFEIGNISDTCFIAKSWHNDTGGTFAGSCVGSFVLVMFAQ